MRLVTNGRHKPQHAVSIVAVIVTTLLPGPLAIALEAATVSRVVAAIERALPPGWAIDAAKAGEASAADAALPSGHWNCRDYSGPRGTMIEAVGPTPIEVEWETDSGESGATPVTWESLKIWVMPPEYRRDSVLLGNLITLFGLLCERSDARPRKLFEGSQAVVYGLPSMLFAKAPVYDEIFRKATKKLIFVASPDVDPSRLSWTDWASDLEAALRLEFRE